MAQPVTRRAEPLAVVIPSGASVTAAIDMRGRTLGAIDYPAAWTAANLTIQVSNDGGATWLDVHKSSVDYDGTSSEVVIPAAASRRVIVEPFLTWCLNTIRLRSGTSAAAVNQAAERTITLQLADTRG